MMSTNSLHVTSIDPESVGVQYLFAFMPESRQVVVGRLTQTWLWEG